MSSKEFTCAYFSVWMTQMLRLTSIADVELLHLFMFSINWQ